MTNHLYEHGKPLKNMYLFIHMSYLVNHLSKHDKPLIWTW